MPGKGRVREEREAMLDDLLGISLASSRPAEVMERSSQRLDDGKTTHTHPFPYSHP